MVAGYGTIKPGYLLEDVRKGPQHRKDGVGGPRGRGDGRDRCGADRCDGGNDDTGALRVADTHRRRLARDGLRMLLEGA